MSLLFDNMENAILYVVIMNILGVAVIHEYSGSCGYGD